MEKYYDIQDPELLEKYPDIKVLKELKPLRVAYYCNYGLEPEEGAFSVMSDWLRRSGLNFERINCGYSASITPPVLQVLIKKSMVMKCG